MTKEILVSYGVDFDAVAGWLGSYGGEDSPCDISRGVFAAERGVPPARLQTMHSLVAELDVLVADPAHELSERAPVAALHRRIASHAPGQRAA